jgi:hypothetical protein
VELPRRQQLSTAAHNIIGLIDRNLHVYLKYPSLPWVQQGFEYLADCFGMPGISQCPLPPNVTPVTCNFPLPPILNPEWQFLPNSCTDLFSLYSTLLWC